MFFSFEVDDILELSLMGVFIIWSGFMIMISVIEMLDPFLSVIPPLPKFVYYHLCCCMETPSNYGF